MRSQVLCGHLNKEMEFAGLVAVGAVWGTCTAFLENAGHKHKPPPQSGFFRNLLSLILHPRFFVPYALDQLASVGYYALLGAVPLTVAVPVANCTAFAMSYLVEKRFAEGKGNKTISWRGVLGAVLVAGGAGLCALGGSSSG